MDYRISEIAKKYGISKRAIRYYEEIGLIRGKREDDSNYKFYPAEEVKKLEKIVLLRRIDFTIEQIKNILSLKENEETAEIFLGKVKEIDKNIGELCNFRAIITSLIKIYNEKGSEGINLYELLKEQIYISMNNERMIGLDNNTNYLVRVELGEGLIPVADDIVSGVKEMRKRIETESLKEIPLIRILDVEDIEKSNCRIKFSDKVVVEINCEELDSKKRATSIVSHLENVVRQYLL